MSAINQLTSFSKNFFGKLFASKKEATQAKVDLDGKKMQEPSGKKKKIKAALSDFTIL